MTAAKTKVLEDLKLLPDDIDNEYDILDGLYKRFRLKQSRQFVESEEALTTEEVRDYFRRMR